jgi:hypothetical protein
MIDLETIRVADECWVALALLHREHPDRLSFSPGEVYDRLKEEVAHPEVRPGVKPHIYLHNVANRPPNSARYRLFYRLEDDTLRLFRPGDECDPTRNGKTKPERSDLPEKYRPLLDWYEKEYCSDRGSSGEDSDPVLQMWGVGKEIWADEGGDAFIERERKSWGE